ncbi:MAG: HIT domain-containing protein, partial [Actinomycetota bacterium]|nr:HIT domain-containing protein [Actinomycetota bacterium]
MSEIGEANADPGCIFCKIVAGELPGEILDEDEATIAFMDINPANPGHALVIPRAHSKDLLEISDDDLAACTLAARRLARKMSETIEPEGFN